MSHINKDLGQRPRVRRPPGTEYEDRYLAPAFKSQRTSVMFWAAVRYNFHSHLILVRQRTPSERESTRDRLGMNSKQYCHEILEAHLIPLIQGCPWPIHMLELIEDGVKCHDSAYSRTFKKAKSINKLPWPPYSPDMNLIENVWALLKFKLRKQWRDVDKRPHSKVELIVAAQLAWGELDWNRIYSWFELMPRRISSLIQRKGRATRW